MYVSNVGDMKLPSPLRLPYGQSEVQIVVETRWGLPVECLRYSDIPITINAECEYETNTYQYRTKLDGETKEVSVVHPVWNPATMSWVESTLPHFRFRHVSSPGFENRADSNYQRRFTVGWATAPSPAPTSVPTEAPSHAPTEAPSHAPIPSPTEAPSEAPTATPSQAPTAAFACAVAVDGDPSRDNSECGSFSDVGLDDLLIIPKANATAGVRCCGATASSDTSICPDGRCSGYAFDTANAFCEGAGLRLCTSVEILLGRARGTGCYYDVIHVWTSDEVPCASKKITISL